MFLILSIKQKLKIFVFFGTFEIETTLKTSFSNRLFISLCFDSTKNIGVNKDKRSFSCKNVETLAIFWYLIGGCYIWKSLVISIKKILVLGKVAVSGNKSGVRDKKFAVERKWFSVLSSSTK